MCLITFAYRIHPKYKLVLVANRDEFHDRPTIEADRWKDPSDIVGGIDLRAGGTWLAASDSGRFAAVTNFREAQPSVGEKSRGDLVRRFLIDRSSPADFAAKLSPEKHLYGGFNLLTSDSDTLFYCSNRSDLSTPVSPGVYSLSNHLLDTPWPKSVWAKQRLKTFLGTKQDEIEATDLFTLLSRTEPFKDDSLPATGVGLEMERTLSPPFIALEDYGTRCTTGITWDYQDNIAFAEQNFLPGGAKGNLKQFDLRG
ncbi:MAG: NRDE family protein [bacterium]